MKELEPSGTREARAGRRVGLESRRDLVFIRADRNTSEIMDRDVESVRAEPAQGERARQFEHYHLRGLPVLDTKGSLVGVVKASEAPEIAFKEATEAKLTTLAVCLPIIAAQGGNAGMQTLTVIICDFAFGELSPGAGRPALLREPTLGSVNGLAIL